MLGLPPCKTHCSLLPHLPMACFQGAQNATPFQYLVWKDLSVFSGGYELFYWFRVAASSTTRNSPYTGGKRTAASSEALWCRAASLGCPCNAHQPPWGNRPQAPSNQQGWQGSEQFLCPPIPQHGLLQFSAIFINVESNMLSPDSSWGAFIWGFWGEEEQSCLGAPWMLQLFFDASQHLWLERVPAPRQCRGGQSHARGCSAQLGAQASPSLHLQLPASRAV